MFSKKTFVETFQFSDNKVDLNLEGVALIAMIGLGLMFALMLCIFYEKALSKYVSEMAEASKKRLIQMRSKRREEEENKEVRQPAEEQALRTTAGYVNCLLN